MPSGVDAGDSGRPAPHAIIKHGVACVGVCADEIFKQRDRLLRRVQAPLAVDLQQIPEFRAFRLSEYSTIPIIGASWSPLCTLLFLLAVEDAEEFVAEIIKLPAPARHRHIFIRRPLRDIFEQRCYQSDIRAAGKLHAPLN